MEKNGRPEELTDELTEDARKYLIASVSIEGVCRLIGIARSTWYLWKKKADAARGKQGDKWKNDQKYVAFFKMVDKALGQAEAKLVLDIQKDNSWQAKHAILKRRFNSEWGELQRIETKDLDIDQKIESDKNLSEAEIKAFKKEFDDEY